MTLLWYTLQCTTVMCHHYNTESLGLQFLWYIIQCHPRQTRVCLGRAMHTEPGLMAGS